MLGIVTSGAWALNQESQEGKLECVKGGKLKEAGGRSEWRFGLINISEEQEGNEHYSLFYLAL